jgi:adenylate cyclase
VDEDRLERRLAAIVAADVAGYSRLMGQDEEGTLRRLKACRREPIDAKIHEHRGRIVKTTGDGILVEFASPVAAVRCAVEIQAAMAERNAAEPAERRIEFRVGINVGDVIADGDDVYGDGVNVAARLEALAEPGAVLISGTVYDYVRDRLPFSFADLGERSVKNIVRPVRLYRWAPPLEEPKQPAAETVGHASGTSLATEPTGSTSIAAGSTLPPPLSIVVLPFANLGNDPEQEYFADAITEDLTTDLSRIAGSFVIARNTAFTFKGKVADVRQVGRELGVRYVLEGSVRRFGQRVRINVQLIETDGGAHLWAERIDTDLASLTEAHDAITGRIARTLNLELISAEGRRAERSANPDAVDYAMRGWALYNRVHSPEASREAQLLFERALAIDSQLVEALVGLASTLAGAVLDGWRADRVADIARAEALLQQALDRVPRHAEAHRTKGVLLRAQGRVEEAIEVLEGAVALDPNHPNYLLQLAIARIYSGLPERAIPEIEKAMRLNPREPKMASTFFALGVCHVLLGQTEQAIAWLLKARLANSRLAWTHLWLAGAYGLSGQLADARSALDEAQRLNPEFASVAKFVGASTMRHPLYTALRERTLLAGLRSAGMPEN